MATHRVSEFSFLPPLPKIVQLSNNNRQGRRAHRDETEIIKRQVSTLRHIFSIYFQRAAVEIRFHRREWQAMHRAGRVIDEKKEGGGGGGGGGGDRFQPHPWTVFATPADEKRSPPPPSNLYRDRIIDLCRQRPIPTTPCVDFTILTITDPTIVSPFPLFFSSFFFPPFFSFSFRERSRRA